MNDAMKDNVFIGRWEYSKPKTVPDAEGNTALLTSRCWGPPQYQEYGLDRDGFPYEKYEWLENYLFEDDNGVRAITREELISHLGSAAAMFESCGYPDWAEKYREIIIRINSGT